MTDFGNAGPRGVTVGKKRQFNQILLIPWEYSFSEIPAVLRFIELICCDFTIMDAYSDEGHHFATLVDNQTGTQLDIELRPKSLKVFPKCANHQESSERLFGIVSRVAWGELKIVHSNPEVPK